MGRPRKQRNGLPSYCYRDKRNGAYYMLVRAEGARLKRRTYGPDLHRMLDDWARTWGATERQGDTVGAALDVFLGSLAQDRHSGAVAASTERDYRKHAEKVRRVWGHVRLSDVDVPALYRWRDVRAPISPVQFNHERTVLLKVFQVAIKRGMVTTNPVEYLHPEKVRPRDRKVTDVEADAVLRHCNRAVQAAAVLSVYTGLRQGDILALKRSDFSESGLTVLPSKTKRKNRKALHFAWTPGLRQACELAARKVTGIDGYWLTRRDGRPYTSSGFRAMWQRAMVKAQAADETLQRFTFHDLRAKAGTESADWRLLGHMDQRTFETTYNRKPHAVRPVR